MPKTHPLRLMGLCVALATGCVGNQESNPSTLNFGPEASVDGGIQVMVQNETSRSLRVYVREGGFDMLLGRVDPLSQESVQLQHASSGLISLVARANELDEDRGHVSEPVEVLRGYRITWVLRASPGSTGPRFSTVRMFRCEEEGC